MKAVAVRIAGQAVEEAGDVRTQLGIAREEAHVLVGRRRRRVVVPRAHVAVATDLAALAANDEDVLRVRLQADDAVHDMNSRLLKCPRPRDVRPSSSPRAVSSTRATTSFPVAAACTSERTTWGLALG